MTSWPAVPDHLKMPHQWEIVFLIAVALFAALGIAWGAAKWRRTGDLMPFALLAGGAACCIVEPLVDALGQCWYPRGQLLEVFELMGYPIPLFAVVGYMMAFGGYTLFTVEVLERKGPQVLWATWVGGIVFMMMFEIFAVTTKSYVYYGEQPLRILDFPAWWDFVNSLVPVTAALVVTVCRQWLTGWRILLVIPMLPMIDAAANAAAALPTWVVLKSDVPEFVMQGAGVLTCVIAALLVWVAVKFTGFSQERTIVDRHPDDLATSGSLKRTEGRPNRRSRN